MATTIISIFLAICGLVLAYLLFRPISSYSQSYRKRETPSSWIGKFVFYGFYFTRLYESTGVGILKLGQVCSFVERNVLDRGLHLLAIVSVIFGKTVAAIDRFLIDGIINGVALFSSALGKRLAGINAREIQVQLIWLLLGIILILGIILLF